MSAKVLGVRLVHPESYRYRPASLLPVPTDIDPARYGVSTLHSRPAGLDPGLAQAKIGRIVDGEHSSRCGDGLRCLAQPKKYFWKG